MCLEIPQRKDMCFKLTKGLPPKMVANCLKLQTKDWLKAKKEVNINKGEKKCGYTKATDQWGPQIKSRTQNHGVQR